MHRSFHVRCPRFVCGALVLLVGCGPTAEAPPDAAMTPMLRPGGDSRLELAGTGLALVVQEADGFVDWRIYVSDGDRPEPVWQPPAEAPRPSAEAGWLFAWDELHRTLWFFSGDVGTGAYRVTADDRVSVRRPEWALNELPDDVRAATPEAFRP